MTVTNCATGTLDPYVPSPEKPWNSIRVQHLYRRMGFGATPAMVEQALSMDPLTVVDNIMMDALNLPLSPTPEWADWTTNDYDDFFPQRQEQFVEWVVQWMSEMIDFGFREKLALFWHNHFVTRFESYECPSYMYKYHKVLQENALGNFKDFVKSIGQTPAMLFFLNGLQNTNVSPNENYARELYELFTLGQDNGYTQEDITETARALTGWNGLIEFCGPVGFRFDLFDTGEKTIFGQTGNWGYDDVHDILFEQRTQEIAQFVCTKIYKHFVHPEPAPEIIDAMAATFVENEFELAPVLDQLFKSEHFFDEYIIGTQVKSPVDFYINFLKEANLPFDTQILEAITYYTFLMGQELFSPVDVAGWPGNRSWINNNTLTGRWQTIDFLIFFMYENAPAVLVDFAKFLSNDSNDPVVVTQSIVDHFIGNGLNSVVAYDRATDVFKWEVPQNYYDQELWDLDWDTVPAQVALLLQHIARIPEFQLH